MSADPKTGATLMNCAKRFGTILLCAPLLTPGSFAAQLASIEGAPTDAGYNAGCVATIQASLKGLSDPSRYAVLADIQYIGTSSLVSVQLDRQAASDSGELRYEGGWPIPPSAPTGIYAVTIRVEDRSSHRTIAERKLRSFAVYRKLVRITRLQLDKTFYSLGEPVQCEVGLENLTDEGIKDLRVEFSNANYPWIALFSAEPASGGKYTENPELGLKVLRDHLSVAARGEATIRMMAAGTAAFLQGAQVAVLGAGGPARHEKVPPPEVDQYTIAVWNGDRSVLYDMQFSAPVIVRPADRDLPKPYGRSFTHPYNSDIDFTRYREFYAPGLVSPAIRLAHGRTLYRPGEHVTLRATLKGYGKEGGTKGFPHISVTDLGGKEICAADLPDLIVSASGAIALDAWTIPSTAAPGVYSLTLSLRGSPTKAEATEEIAVNALPASLLVFAPHEDDEHAYAGLIRAAVEAGVPVRVVAFTGGDVGACERYYSKPCGPNEARQFGLVRMEETAEALEHLGLPRDKLNFLGLPDGGLGAVWSPASNTRPFLPIYLATDHAPYDNVLRPNLAYSRGAVIGLVKEVIAGFHPAMIATPHPDERHVDHRTTNWFVVKACQELVREGRLTPETVILADRAYGAGGFKSAPYRYEKFVVYVSGEPAALKQEMSWIYQSQDGNLAEGMRKTFAELPREEIHYRIVDWKEHEGWNE